MIRRPSAAIVLVALLTVGCHATKGAAVLSLEKAADVAVIHVADPASPNQPLVLFMMPQPLPAGTIVDTNRPPSTDTGDPGAEPSNPIHEIETETWLLWTDDPVEDSTRIVLIDRATGGVSTAGSDQWPLVDGEIPWVATASYWAPQARVFENVVASPMEPTAAKEMRAATHPRGLLDDLSLFSFHLQHDGRAVAALIRGCERGDKLERQFGCNLNQVGVVLSRLLTDTEAFNTSPDDRRAMRRWFEVKARELVAGDTLVAYLAGHGSDLDGGEVGGFFAFTLQSWLREFNPSVRIVVIVDSCFSRSWEDSMRQVSDQVMTSTSKGTCAWSDLDRYWQGTELEVPDVNPQDRGTENTSSWVAALHAILDNPALESAVEARAALGEETLVEALLTQAYANGVLLDAAAINGITLPRSVGGADTTSSGH